MEDRRQDRDERVGPPGIVIRKRPVEPSSPRVVAFIWGGKVRRLPTLPFGRWKKAVAA